MATVLAFRFFIFMSSFLSLSWGVCLHAASSSAQWEPKSPVRVALVLGGGGSRALAQLGVIRELEEAGIRPDLIVGCSAGAIVGAFYADDPALANAESNLLAIKRSDLMRPSLAFRYGYSGGEPLETFLKRHLRASTFSLLEIPLIVVATDLALGETVELFEGDVTSAVTASCAFPGYFKPRILQGRTLVDGGVTDPIPVDIAKKYGAKVVIAIDVGEKLSSGQPSHLFGVLARGAEIIYNKLIERSLYGADVVIKMEFDNVWMFDDAFNNYLYESGRAKAKEMLPEILETISQKISQ